MSLLKFVAGQRKNAGVIMTPSGQLMPQLVDIPVNPANGFLGPQYPGQKAGLTNEQVKKFNREYALKAQGIVSTVPAGNLAFNLPNLQIQGEAWALVGISAHAITNWNNDAITPDSFNLTINNEQVIQSMPFNLIDVKYMTNIYYPFERFLNGNDTISLQINNPNGAQKIGFNFYYL